MKIAIIGLGYVGLPLACLCAKKGFSVIGLEKNPSIVQKVNAGKSHIKDDWLQESLELARHNLIVTTIPEEIKDASVFIICVPTPVNENKEPDFEPLITASESVSPFIKKGDLVIVESTVFPGTCEDYVIPVINSGSGLKAGEDYFFAHCPERVNPGDAFWTVDNIPRVVGGLTKDCTDKAADFYQKILGGPIYSVDQIREILRPKFLPEGKGYRVSTIPLGSVTKMASLRDAEAVKAMENAVRDVNIAFVNELAKISSVLNLNVVDIVEGMSTKPFGKGPFYPGIGVGGHCIAVDPEWLKSASIKAGFFPKIIQISRDTNNSMPQYAVDSLMRLMGSIKGKKIAILGVTYKGNIDDPRESPFYEVRRLIEKEGAEFSVYDPLYMKENTSGSIDDALKGCDAVVLVTDHNEFKEKVTSELLKKNSIKAILDGRNCLDKKSIVKAGVKYIGIGR